MKKHTTAAVQNTVVIGGGITGCVLAERIKQRQPDRSVTLLEAQTTLGGLSVSADPDVLGWDRFYHVVAAQDVHLQDFLRRIGCHSRLRFRPVHTGFYANGQHYFFDTPLDFVRFSPLSWFEKTRLVAGLVSASAGPTPTNLWDLTAKAWLSDRFGEPVYQKFWAPLLRAKLGEAAEQAAAAFIFSTILRLQGTRQGRRKQEAFGYIRGGYQAVFRAAERHLGNMGVTVQKGVAVQELARDLDGLVYLRLQDGRALRAARVVYTGPTPLLAKLGAPGLLSPNLAAQAQTTRYLGVLCLAVKLLRPLVPYYVLNLLDPTLPFTGVIGLTTLVDPSEIGGHHLVYLPSYLPDDHPDFGKSDAELTERFLQGLDRVCAHRGFRRDEIVKTHLFRARFVSPLPVRGYNQRALPLTLVPGRLYLVNSGRILGGTLNNNQMIEEAERGIDEIFASETAACA